jgi:hypothetical protein
MRRTARVLSVLSALSLAPLGALGCAKKPLVEAQSLPLRRVVLYRNGVAYFERGAMVSAPNVEFHVRESELGDFLASLSILEASGRTVKAAAYPVEGIANARTNPANGQRSRTVSLELEGPPGKLSVGYIAHSPVWKPAYRVVVMDDGKALLQSWAVIHNRSGEDWPGVRLSVVSGAPLAFSSTLGEAFIPSRPVLEDRGDVVAAIPTGTSVVGAPPAAMAMAAAPPPRNERGRAAAKRERRPGEATAEMATASEPAGAYAFAAEGALGGGQPSAPPPMPSEQASVAQSGSMSRFDLPSTITVPDGSATMALLNAKVVKGDVILLFAPDGRVGESQQFPWRVARFTNEIGATLERGPLAVFGRGAFLGEGELPSLMAGSDATIPFALDRGITVRSVASGEQGGSRLWSIRDGQIVIKTEHKAKTTYEVASAAETPEQLRIRHPAPEGARIVVPAGVKVEEEFGRPSVLVPLEVAARGKAAIEVAQVTEHERYADWFSTEAELALQRFLANEKLQGAVRERVASVVEVRDRIAKLRRDRDAVYTEANGLEREQQELRANLTSIEKNPQAADLRAKLVERLSRASRRADDLAKRRIELELQENVEQIQFQERLKGLVVQES